MGGRSHPQCLSAYGAFVDGAPNSAAVLLFQRFLERLPPCSPLGCFVSSLAAPLVRYEEMCGMRKWTSAPSRSRGPFELMGHRRSGSAQAGPITDFGQTGSRPTVPQTSTRDRKSAGMPSATPPKDSGTGASSAGGSRQQAVPGSGRIRRQAQLECTRGIRWHSDIGRRGLQEMWADPGVCAAVVWAPGSRRRLNLARSRRRHKVAAAAGNKASRRCGPTSEMMHQVEGKTLLQPDR